ncbi:hypothetical protein [Streptomyces sp. 900105245]
MRRPLLQAFLEVARLGLGQGAGVPFLGELALVLVPLALQLGAQLGGFAGLVCLVSTGRGRWRRRGRPGRGVPGRAAGSPALTRAARQPRGAGGSSYG